MNLIHFRGSLAPANVCGVIFLLLATMMALGLVRPSLGMGPNTDDLSGSTCSPRSSPIRSFERVVYVRNDTQAMQNVWLRVVDASPYDKVEVVGALGFALQPGSTGRFRLKLETYVYTPKPREDIVRCLVGFQASGGLIQWMTRDIQAGTEVPTTIFIDAKTANRRQDVLFIRNGTQEPITIGLVEMVVPNPGASEKRDYEVNTVERIKTQSVVVAPGGSIPWLSLRHDGTIGQGSRVLKVVLNSATYGGLAEIHWEGVVSGMVTITPEALRTMADAQAKARVELSERQLAEVQHRQIQHEQSQAEAAERRVAAMDRRRRVRYRDNGDAENVVGALLVLGIVAVLASDLFGGGSWQQGTTDEEVQQEHDRLRYFAQRREYEEYQRKLKESIENDTPPPPPVTPP